MAAGEVGAQSVMFYMMEAREFLYDLVEAVTRDPDVESISSFVGVDGSNTTLNTGRLLISLKPREGGPRRAAGPCAWCAGRRSRVCARLPAAGSRS